MNLTQGACAAAAKYATRRFDRGLFAYNGVALFHWKDSPDGKERWMHQCASLGGAEAFSYLDCVAKLHGATGCTAVFFGSGSAGMSCVVGSHWVGRAGKLHSEWRRIAFHQTADGWRAMEPVEIDLPTDESLSIIREALLGAT